MSQRRIGLVGCVKEKQDHAAPARDLYTSPLFRGRREAVEDTCERWFVLSALHGLLEPDEVVTPYDKTLSNAPRSERRAWSARVLDELDERCGDLADCAVEVHAGAAYYDFGLIEGLEARGVTVEVPTKGLGMGEQLRFYRRRS